MSEEIKLPLGMPTHGINLALNYLNYLVTAEYIPDDVALFYAELTIINDKPIHYFLTEALVEYYISLSQEPDKVEEQVH
jgi:hypothetical protein